MENLNPDLSLIVISGLTVILLLFLTFGLGIKYGYNKRYGEQSNTKPHQVQLLFLIGGALMGYIFAYYMLSKSVSFQVERAYEDGINFQKEITEQTYLSNDQYIIDRIDSILIYTKTKK